MKIHRQLVFCWILGASWLVIAAYVFVRPRIGAIYYPAENVGRSLVWSSSIGGRQYAVLQVYKGYHLEKQWRFSKSLPSPMREALMVRTLNRERSLSFSTHVTSKAYWVYRNDGATRNASAIIVADHGFSLPLPVEGILLAIGLTVIVAPTATIFLRQRKFQQSLPEEGLAVALS